MRILISGATGLIGSHLVASLREKGHVVVRLVRSTTEPSQDIIYWDPKRHEINLDEFEGFDGVINLAGENIASGRWTEDKKKRIPDSRVLGTRMLSDLMAQLENPPSFFINASAVGYYGDQGETLVNEKSPNGTGFLAGVCKQWEDATASAVQKGIRVVRIRMGVVLTEKGGALKKMLFPFRLGLGGRIGSGKQYMSWISLDDLMGIFHHIIENESISGPVNAVTPNPVTNEEFTKTLGKVLRRPTIFPIPAFFLRLMLGEMADEMLLSSVRASPDVLKSTHYTFLYSELEDAFIHLLHDR